MLRAWWSIQFPQVLFASGVNGVYKSTDGGQTWRTVYTFTPVALGGGGVAIDPGNHLRIAALNPFSGAVISSLDGGETWTAGAALCQVGDCVGQLFSAPTGPGTLLVKSLNFVSISRDWGATLQPIKLPGSGSVSTAAFDPSHPGWIYLDLSGSLNGSLWLSTDYGATWTAKGSPTTSFSAIESLVVDPANPNTILASTIDGVYLSTDGATSWTRKSPSSGFLVQGMYGLALPGPGCAPSGALFAVGNSLGTPGTTQVAFSPDYGVTWPAPQLSGITSVSAGPGCGIYVTKQISSDAFVAKLAADGSVLWTTYLGGSDLDTPAALALDNQGNVYVTGNTSSPDFPTTVPRIGVHGQSAVFVTGYSASGAVLSSVVFGGESRETAAGIALDSARNAYVVGTTSSQSFPITGGALVSKLDANGAGAGFVAKLTPGGSLAYASYLAGTYAYAGAVIVDGSDEAIIAGRGPVPGSTPPVPGATAEFVMKLDQSGSQVRTYTYLKGAQAVNGGPTSLAQDGAGNLFVYGATGSGSLAATPGAYQSPAPLAHCGSIIAPFGDAYIVKLSAANWTPVFTALLHASCGFSTGAMAVDKTGAATVAMATGPGLPLRHPLVGGPACSNSSSAIAQLSADGSTLQFASYLDDCGVSGLALAPDGSIYAGVSLNSHPAPAGVLHLNPASAPVVSLDGVANAFSGDGSAVASGGLYALRIAGFQPATVDLGLNPSQSLPTALGGVQVMVDGTPAPIQQTSSGQVIIVAPAPMRTGRAIPGVTELVALQVIANGIGSNTVWMPLASSAPGLMTATFPNLAVPDSSGFVDGFARNPDGSVNSASNPAAIGSSMTFYLTGVGATNPNVEPGSIASGSAVVPVLPIFSSWDRSNGSPFNSPGDAVSSVPGYVSAIFQLRLATPTTLQNVGDTPLPNGVHRVPVNLVFGLFAPPSAAPASNTVGVYLK